jgi:hypothetical protein
LRHHISSLRCPISQGRKKSVKLINAKLEQAERGAQIDFLFDREDDVISLCEAKYYHEPFAIDRVYAETIERKISVFRQRTKTNKSIFFVLIAPHGVVENNYLRRLVTNIIKMKPFFSS